MFEQSEEEMPGLETRAKTNEKVWLLADEFAAQVPALKLSPAEVLSFLLEKRTSPSSAVADAGEWVSRVEAKTRALRRGDSWVHTNVGTNTLSTLAETTGALDSHDGAIIRRPFWSDTNRCTRNGERGCRSSWLCCFEFL